ncbi:hypothetical protein JCM8547_008854 [Rhodosporidiobolus lusitaniae]
MLLKPLVASLALVAASAGLVDASKILVPLYSWSKDCWPELQSAATANPTASFIGIINPNSGPTVDTSDPSLYCVPVLRKKIPNLTLAGYVRTNYSERAPSEVLADIRMYKSWSTLSTTSPTDIKGTPKLDGIFFDEVSSFTESTNGINKYILYSQQARQALGSKSMVVFNPGLVPNARLFSYADLVVTYEDRFSAYSLSKLPKAAYMQQKSAIMIHTMPNSTATLNTTLRGLGNKFGAVYVTSTDIDVRDVYQVFGSNWSQFVKLFTALQGKTTTATGKVRRLLSLE